jgi:hypothetical protein
MYIAISPTHLFYSAGKVGTQTLSNLEGCSQVMPTVETKLLRKEAAAFIKRRLITNRSKILTLVIRDPTSRFFSGLYEIIAKQIYGTNIVHHAYLHHNAETVQSHIDLFYDVNFWKVSLDMTLRLRPDVWDHDNDLASRRWQYHVGNWLTDVVDISSYAQELGITTEIVDIKQLTSYLKSRGLGYKHFNKSENMMYHLAFHSDPYASIYANVDHSRIQQAFRAAYERIDHCTAAQFNNYLAPETELYLQLKSKSIVL